jgi:RHS repeat-associated protein
MLSASNGATTVNAVYDALGRLVEKSQNGTSTEFIYGPSGTRMATANGQTLIKAFIALPGGAKAIYTSSGLAHYRHSDWLGSSRLTSTQSRTLYSSSAYAPFGEQYGTSGSVDSSFTGQNSDVISSLYDFMFREHSPSQGRWISPDPIGRGSVSLASPQSWNRYAYVNNNPLAFVDSQGLFYSTAQLLNSLNNGGGNQDSPDSGGGPGGNNTKHPEAKPNGEQSGGSGVSAKDPKKNPCVLVAGGVGDNVGDSGFAGVYTLGGDATFPYDQSVIAPDPDLGQVATDVLAVSDQALNGPNPSTASISNAVVSTTANNDNVLLVLFSGSGQAFSTAVTYGGIGQAQLNHISGIIYVSPGSPGGFPNVPGDIPTMTFEATGSTDAVVAGGNLVGGSISGTLSQGNLGSVEYPGLQDTPLPCPHSVTCEVTGPNGVLNGVQSDCNHTNGSTDGSFSGQLLLPNRTQEPTIYEQASHVSRAHRIADEKQASFQTTADEKDQSMISAAIHPLLPRVLFDGQDA